MEPSLPDVLDDLDAGISVHDPETGALVGVTDRFETLFGETAPDTTPNSENGVQRLCRAVADGERGTVEWMIQRGDGDHVRVRVGFTETTLDGERYVMAESRVCESRAETPDQALQQLHDTAARSAPFENRLADLLAFGREYFGVEQGFFTRIKDGTQEIRLGVGPNDQLQTGATAPLEESYCRHTLGRDSCLTVRNAVEEGWADDPGFERFGLACYAGTTVEVDGEAYGTICFADRDPPEAGFTAHQATVLELVADWVSYELGQRDREQRYERLTERIAAGYYALDTDWTVTYWNETVAQRHDMPAAEIVGETIWEVFPEIEGTVVGETFREAMASGDRRTCEFYYEGDDAWVELRVYPDEAGITVLSTEITDRKEREQQLRDLHEATRTLLTADTRGVVAELVTETVTDVLDFPINGVMFADETSDALVPATTSAAGLDVFGEAPVLDSGLGWEAFQAGEDRLYEDIHETDRVYNPDTPIHSEMYLPLGEHGLLLIGSTDVEAFDETDLALTKILAANVEGTLDRMAQEDRYRRLTERIPSGYYAFDTDWTVTYWNETIAQRQDLPAAEIVGETLWDVFPEIEDTEYGDRLREAMATGEPQDVEFYYEPDDYWVRSRMYPDEDGLVVLSTDITDQKEYETELEHRTDQLELLNRIMRHDINNDLQIIHNWTQLAMEKAPPDTADRLANVLETCLHMMDLTENAQELVGLLTDDAEIEPGAISLAAVIETVLDRARSKHPNAEISCGELPAVSVQATEMLSSVFRNLVNNAVQHNDSESPRVAVGVEPREERVRVTVADNGPGIPDHRKDAVFGKGERGLDSDGTGMGLYLVHTLVTEFGGSVTIEDNDPTGTIFIVELPLAA